MQYFKYLSSLLLLLTIFLYGQGQILIADRQQSDYRIILPVNPSVVEIQAANELQKHLVDISGALLPIMADSTDATAHEIILGRSSRLETHKIKTKFKRKDLDGFILLTHDEKLFITGNTPQGTRNGVYIFLEKYLGCKLYSSSVKYLPDMQQISLPEIKDRQEPVFSYRELHFPGKYDTSYLSFHKLHSHHDGNWGMWVHTFDDLVPPGVYFNEHPEYFSEINGSRVPYGQLCLSNPEVFTILKENLAKKMKRRPNAHYWSVSQNDNFLACQCASCRKTVEELGGESGLMLQFVNRVAELYPDKTISTLAYQYTRSAPKKIKPLPNVNIMFCSIECNRSMPIEGDPGSASFVKDMKDWTRLTGNILVWDYVVQFRNYISPFPNLRVLQPNLEFFARHGCRLMFQQGSGQSLSEFVELRSYLIAKLLWNPGLDLEAVMKDFIYGYYGPAAPFIEEYIEMLHDALENSGDNLWIYGFPYSGIDSYLSPVNIPFYQDLFDKAERAAERDTLILDRVWFARLPLDFAVLDISLHQVDGHLSWLKEVDGELVVKEEMMNLLDQFTARCKKLGVEILNEQGLTPDNYRKNIIEYLQKSSGSHLALHKKVQFLSEYSPKYEAGGDHALSDGIRGLDDYHFNWLGFEGKDLEVIVDLEEETVISEISVDFLQDNRAWVFLPNLLSVSYSDDNTEFKNIGAIRNTTSDRKAGVFIQTFTVQAIDIKARYVKVKAEALKTCPQWHIGAGKDSWIFVDEIVIR